jgi:hypothetical protein
VVPVAVALYVILVTVTLVNSTVDETADIILPVATKFEIVVLIKPTTDWVLADRNMSLLIIKVLVKLTLALIA